MNSVEIAIRMETDAIEFYREAAQKTSHPFGKRMFLSFVEDEKRHLEMLDSIFKGFDISIQPGEPMHEMKSIFEEHKGELMQRISATSDELNSVRIALEMEKEGYNYYRRAAQQAETEQGKKLFERLSYEEDKHYRILENTHTYLTDSGNWYMWNEYSIVEG